MSKRRTRIFPYLLSLTAFTLGISLQEITLGEPESISFIVGFDESSLMKGVDVFLIDKGGETVSLGKTDILGRLSVDKERLSKEGVAVLFCREAFFCGALLLNEERFFEIEERYIKLAPVAWL